MANQEEIWDLFALASILIQPEDTLHWMRILKKLGFQDYHLSGSLSVKEMLSLYDVNLSQQFEQWIFKAHYYGLSTLIAAILPSLPFSYSVSSLFLELLYKIEKTTPGIFLTQRLKQTILLYQHPDSVSKEGIQLMTIHASKGLEFSCVALIESGHPFYSPNPDCMSETTEEEKRLFYVACTRAKDHLLIMGNKSDKPSYLNFVEGSKHI